MSPRRHGWLIRSLNLVVVFSMLLALGAPAVQPPRSLAAPPVPQTVSQPLPGSAAPLVPQTVSQPLPDPALASPEAVPAVSVEPDPPAEGAELAVTVDPPEARPGEQVTVTVHVAPRGELADAALVAPLARGLGFAGAEGEGAQFDAAEHKLHWPLGKVAQGNKQTWRFQLQVEDDAADVTRQRIELQAAGGDGPVAVAEAVIKRPFPASEARVTPEEGGELRSADGRVRVVFPKGAVERPLRVEHKPKRVDPLPQGAGRAIEFELNAFTDDAEAKPVVKFAKPLKLQVDLAGLVDLDDLPDYRYPYLAYRENGKWVEIGNYPVGSVLVAELDHFTLISSGTSNVSESGWVLTFNDATVGAFSGALTYNYPIEVPAGRGGLTPDVNLSYNSRRVDGILTWIQTDWVGLGWTLDTMEIARKVKPAYGGDAWQWGWYDWEEDFTLLYKGTGYKLKAATANVPDKFYGRYYTEDEQFLYIERRNDLNNRSPVNRTGEYWIVRLRDGTEYRLGYNRDSEQSIHVNCNSGRDYDDACYPDNPTTDPSRYGSKWDNGVGDFNLTYRWRVDLIQDLHGNRIEFSYTETPQDDKCGPPMSRRDRSNLLREIRYNFLRASDVPTDTTVIPGTIISFTTALRWSDEVGDEVIDEFGIRQRACTPFYQDDFLQRILVNNLVDRASRQYNIVREYVLEYEADSSPPGHDNNTRRLISITPYGWHGRDGGQALPATTFEYNLHGNKGDCVNCSDPWDKEPFRYERLRNIYNGYGGVITANYETSDGGYWGAWNYRVSTKTVSGGWSGGYQLAYTYAPSTSDRCYEDPPGYVRYWTNPTSGSLIGYRYVTETLQTIAGTPIASTAYTFRLNAGGTSVVGSGRELTRIQKDAAGNALQKTITTWLTETGAGLGSFIHPQQVEEFTREGSELPASPQKKTYYEYAPAQQGGAQYGNLTGVVEHQGGTAYRQTQTSYYPNTGLWIVDRPAVQVMQAVKDGVWNTQSKTRYFYDGSTSYSAPPVRGDVTRVDTTRAVKPADIWLTVQKTTYDPAYFYLPTEVTDANGNTTQTTYDPTWKLYPLTVTNAKGKMTTYEYDYLFSTVKKVTGPNGADTATSYEYDSFGRLLNVIAPGDSPISPTLKYNYCDTCTPLRIKSYTQPGGQSNNLPTIRFYNGLGQLIQENLVSVDRSTDRGDTRVTHLTYNAQGQQAAAYVMYTLPFTQTWDEYVSIDTTRPKTSYEYDALGRVTRVTNPDGTAARMAYDGFRVATLDENGHQKISESDVFGRLKAVKEYEGTYPSANWVAAPYATTTYTYNVRDLLTQVTDAVGNQTTIAYDPLGRKIGMTDPDMGTWSYAYDNAGNLTRQTDAKKQSTCFCYDQLNRVTGKDYVAGGACPGTLSPEVTYSYDETTNGPGIGYRTSITDSTGSTTWAYDTRGRVSQEVKMISGQSFTTAWTYDSRDQVMTQVYPPASVGAAETVTTTYNRWGLPSTLNGADAYVTTTWLTNDGRVSRLKLGGTADSPTLQIDYIYHPWTEANGRGRLKQIMTGPPESPTELQSLSYTYDAVGNVQTIQDMKVISPTVPTVTFSYDHLDRLTGASGSYSGQYSYDAIGNLKSRNGAGYSYDEQKKHAVHTVTGTGQPVTQTVTIWARGVTTDGTNPQMTLQVNGTNRATWTVAAGDEYQPYRVETPLSGRDLFELWYDNDNAARELRVYAVVVSGPGVMPYHAGLPAVRHTTEGAPGPTPTPGSMPGGGTIVRADGGAMIYGRGTADTTFQAPNVVPGQERLDQGGALRFVLGAGAYAAEYDANGNMTSRVTDGQAQVLEWDAENRLVSVAQGASTSTFAYDGDSNRVLATVDGVTTRYVGGYYEKIDGPSGSTVRTYYYHNGQRIAMRENGVTTWLLGDHLGSTSVTYRASDGETKSQRYEAWGLIRSDSANNALPTDYTFTGQKLDEQSGLMYYGARWYDPYVARFVSPDTIVPQPGNPQDLNRFSYVRNNPLLYNDPSGHFINIGFALVGAGTGALIGVIASAGPQLLANVQSGAPLTANLDVTKIARSAVIGAATGAVSGLTFGLGLAAGTAACGALGITGSGTIASSVAGGAVVALAGAASGQASRAVGNKLEGRPIGEGLGQPEDMALDAVTSMFAFKMAGGRFSAIPPANYTSLGPFGKKTIPSSNPRHTTKAERNAMQEIGQCHICGATEPGGRYGKFYADHVPPRGGSLAPSCANCSNAQGGLVRWGNDGVLPNHIWSGHWWIGSQSSYWQLWDPLERKGK